MGVLQRLFGTKPQQESSDSSLALERTVQGLRLDLQERDLELERLRAELSQCKNNESARIAVSVQSALEALLVDAASPIAQLHTQAHLLHVEEKPVQAKDVLATAGQLVRLFEERGLTIEGQVGERVAFDPNCHTPLSSEEAPAPGSLVTIRIAGVSYRGKILRKAGVARETFGEE